MTAEAFAAKFAEYVRTNLVAEAVNPLTKFKLGFASAMIGPSVAKMVADAGAVDSNGDINEAALRAAVKAGFDAAGTVTIGGLTFGQTDADRFFASLAAPS